MAEGDNLTVTAHDRAQRALVRTSPFVVLGFGVGGLGGLSRGPPRLALASASAVASNFGIAALACFASREALEASLQVPPALLDTRTSMALSVAAGGVGGFAVGMTYGTLVTGSLRRGSNVGLVTAMAFAGFGVAMENVADILDKFRGVDV